MEQQTALIQQTYKHLLVQAHTRLHMTSARKHACMKNWKNTNPLSGLDGTGNSIHSANIHNGARANTCMTSAQNHACIKN